ncbi:MAG: Flp family type IVb pilin [Tepidisphaeraceae bacterium]
MRNLINRCLRDDRGTETLEYALIVGFIICGAVLLVAGLGARIVDRWIRIDRVM